MFRRRQRTLVYCLNDSEQGGHRTNCCTMSWSVAASGTAGSQHRVYTLHTQKIWPETRPDHNHWPADPWSGSSSVPRYSKPVQVASLFVLSPELQQTVTEPIPVPLLLYNVISFQLETFVRRSVITIAQSSSSSSYSSSLKPIHICIITLWNQLLDPFRQFPGSESPLHSFYFLV